MHDVVIIGAGAAGLSAAAALKMRGIDAIVLERDAAVGGSWARRYDRLHLHTVRSRSGLAHWPIPRDRPKYLARDEFVAYLKDYARHFALNIVPNTLVESVRAVPGTAHWRVSAAGASWEARVVVIAVGHYGKPRLPPLPGRDLFAGAFVHSVQYRNAQAFAGRRVLVVGAGNSGAEIAADLADHGAAFVAISVRSAPPIVPRDPFGRPVQLTGMLLSKLPPRIADRIARFTSRLVLGDLTRYGFPAPDWQPYSSRRVPIIDVGFVRALKQGRVQVRPALQRLSASGAVYADGREEAFDAIIAATGFDTGLGDLLGASPALDAAQEPTNPSAEATACAGLYFIGYVHTLRGHLFEAHRASLRLARNVARYLESAG